MIQNDSLPLNEAQRQSPVAILIIFQRLFRTMIRAIWPLFIFYFINPEKTFEYYITIVGIGVIFLSSIRSFISYLTFHFHLDNNELVIREGFFNKTNRNIPFDRIQTINFTQTIVHQFFNVVSLNIDTAGSKGNEFSIKALSKEKAEDIRNFILSNKSDLIIDESVEDSDTQEIITPIKETPLLRLSVSDLLKIGVSQNHMRTVGVIIAFFFGLSDYVEELLGKDTFSQIWSFFNSGFFKIILLTSVLLIISFFISLIRTVLRYFNLVFYKTTNGFKIQSGLFTRQEQSAQIQKIQLVQWSTNPIKSYFGLSALYLRQAASGAIARKQTIYVPGCYDDQIQTVRQTYFPNEATTHFFTHQISPLIINRRMLYFGILPSIFLLVNSYDSGWKALLWLLLIPIVYITSVYYHRKWKYDLSADGLRTKKGIIGQNASLLRWNKVQGINIQQSFYQRRKRLADITFYTAGGAVKIPYIELEKAETIMNYVLYKVEIDEKKWM